MYGENTEYSISVEVFCSKCGNSVHFEYYHIDSNRGIVIDAPVCDSCRHDIYNSGYEDGKDDGYDQGYEEGLEYCTQE